MQLLLSNIYPSLPNFIRVRGQRCLQAGFAMKTSWFLKRSDCEYRATSSRTLTFHLHSHLHSTARGNDEKIDVPDVPAVARVAPERRPAPARGRSRDGSNTLDPSCPFQKQFTQRQVSVSSIPALSSCTNPAKNAMFIVQIAVHQNTGDSCSSHHGQRFVTPMILFQSSRLAC
jgi:hypothetical protein